MVNTDEEINDLKRVNNALMEELRIIKNKPFDILDKLLLNLKNSLGNGVFSSEGTYCLVHEELKCIDGPTNENRSCRPTEDFIEDIDHQSSSLTDGIKILNHLRKKFEVSIMCNDIR